MQACTNIMSLNIQERRKKLRELILADRKKWQCELSKQGLTLYTDTLL